MAKERHHDEAEVVGKNVNFRIVALLIFVVCLTACGTTRTHDYPKGWPPLDGLSANCREVRGTYIDPNRMGYIFDKKGMVLENQSTGEVPAWFAFGLDPSLVRENQTFLKNRTISISFEGARTLVLVYSIDGVPVLSKLKYP